MQRWQFWFKNRDYAWKYKLRICLPIIGALIALDWITKLTILKTMKYGTSATFIPKFLRLNFIINLGSARGTNQDNLALVITLATLFTIFMLVLLLLSSNRKWLIGLSFLNAGSLGNLLGRAWTPSIYGFNTKGGVIDFLQWDFAFLGGNNYIFNLADVFVITGSVILVLVLISEITQSFRKSKKSKSPVDLGASQERTREAN